MSAPVTDLAAHRHALLALMKRAKDGKRGETEADALQAGRERLLAHAADLNAFREARANALVRAAELRAEAARNLAVAHALEAFGLMKGEIEAELMERWWAAQEVIAGPERSPPTRTA